MDADGARDGARRRRTVKSCGSDAAIAGVKSGKGESLTRATEAKELFSPGRARSKP